MGDLPKIKDFQIALNPEEHALLTELATAAGMKKTPFARQLFVQALEEASPAAPLATPSPRNQKWHAIVEAVLKEGRPADRDRLTGLLMTFADLLEARAGTLESSPTKKGNYILDSRKGFKYH